MEIWTILVIVRREVRLVRRVLYVLAILLQREVEVIWLIFREEGEMVVLLMLHVWVDGGPVGQEVFVPVPASRHDLESSIQSPVSILESNQGLLHRTELAW